MPAAAIGSIVGAAADGLFGMAQQRRNENMQKTFARKGIQWKVKDAQKAGIHPLFALGAQTHQFSPTTVGSNFAGMGQELGRAIEAQQPQAVRQRANVARMEALQLQRAELENTLLASQIARVNQAGAPPPPPAPTDNYLIAGQPQSAPLRAVGGISSGRGSVIEQPLERVMSAPGAPNQEPGAINDVGYIRTASGWQPVQSENAKQRLEEDLVGTMIWNLRNRLMPSFHVNRQPPKGVPLRPGYKWVYDQFAQEYRQIPDGVTKFTIDLNRRSATKKGGSW